MLISIGKAISPSWRKVKTGKKRPEGVLCAAAAGTGSLMEEYRMLRIQPGASEKEVKKAFRRLALQYHPDVCKGSNCGVQFHRINKAYDVVISSLRASEEEEQELESWQNSNDWVGDEEDPKGMYDSSWDSWEEWMGWEGASVY
ncbi:chaperone protein dnaJ 8, chloroplastic [Dendrobium catenatum]|uniref:Chaperone protein dnaJ 8, chloroplastic n=1 Tax=Dendrobium catenatum TaxID=906689 RepID=A0A2I0VF46_9ASPA|nr:chaperone protein dnaJ 8, chloroplastic [Dendrobium catenatum]PKU62046.1 Chaperone protein dnaJ 8, chloroplastic [Dendrobium catenatum]